MIIDFNWLLTRFLLLAQYLRSNQALLNLANYFEQILRKLKIFKIIVFFLNPN
jgi:hypothetical protein